MHQRDRILELRSEGKSYSEIQNETGASKATISYHCGDEQKNKNKIRGDRNKKKHPYIRKYYQFIDKSRCGRIKNVPKYQYKMWVAEAGFTWHDVISKFGESPDCYLCGERIDIHKTSEYCFDHIKPFAKGGACDLKNLGIACKFCNQSKSELNPEEYYSHCKKVLKQQGYKISK